METLTRASPSAGGEQPAHRRRTFYVLVSAGVFLGYAALLAAMSNALATGEIERATTLAWITGASVVAGAAYLVSLLYLTRKSAAIPSAWIIGVAMLARLIVIASPPLQESDAQDYERYLWDGAVLAHGINPYRHAPADVAVGLDAGTEAQPLHAVASESGLVLSKINHPHLTTIYPSLAQTGFAAAYVLDPFGITGWRIVLCVTDAVTILLLMRLLRTLALPAIQIAWFAWNPLLLREVYASLHMDMLVLPLIAGAILAGVRSRGALAAALCVAGSAVKVWPILLVPLMLRPLWRNWRAMTGAVVISAALFVLLWAPVFAVPFVENNGFIAYTQGWQNNDGFFRVGIWLTECALSLIHGEPWHSHGIMRIVSAAIVLATMAWQLGVKQPDPRDLPRRCLVVVGVMFLVSPTQFPWYWLWCLPLLTIRPCFPLLLYTALLPLYYVQDRIVAVHWIEHLPVWTFLTFEGARTLRSHRASRNARFEVAHA